MVSIISSKPCQYKYGILYAIGSLGCLCSIVATMVVAPLLLSPYVQ